MAIRQKKIQLAFVIYWIMLGYMLAALIFWFIALNKQNELMLQFKTERLQKNAPNYEKELAFLQKEKQKKVTQYIGEGSTFMILIIAGAIFVFRIVRRQLKQNKEQQNFLISITHELKTPIAVTKLNLETLQKRKLDVTQQQRLIYNSLTEANRLNDLCNNLLLSSQLQSKVYNIMREEIDLSAFAEKVVHDFSQRYSAQPIETHIQPGILMMGDENLLQMVTNNLLDNAVKYGGRYGTICLQLKTENNKAKLIVSDAGPGIHPDEREKIFHKFYRTGNDATKKAKGTGLGLYLCRRILEVHKGQISLEQNANGGSDFIAQFSLLPHQNLHHE